MSRRSPQLLVADMLEAIAKIERYISDLTESQFLEDERTSDAVVRNLEIIGEAASRLPDAYRSTVSQVPWHQVIGLRHRIVHEYLRDRSSVGVGDHPHRSSQAGQDTSRAGGLAKGCFRPWTAPSTTYSYTPARTTTTS